MLSGIFLVLSLRINEVVVKVRVIRGVVRRVRRDNIVRDWEEYGDGKEEVICGGDGNGWRGGLMMKL